MVNLKVSRAIFAFAFIITVFLLAPASAADSSYRQEIFFLGINAGDGPHSAGSNLTVETTIINKGSNPQANLTVYYKLSRRNDSALIFSEPDSLDLGSKEARVIKKVLSIPSMVIPGSYDISIEVVSASGTPVSSIFQGITLGTTGSLAKGVLFREGEFYLEVPVTQTIADGITETKTKYMYGFVGDTIPKGNPISAHFSLSNPGNSGLNLSARLEVLPSYGKTNLNIEPQIIEEELGYMDAGTNKTSSINFSIGKPGTYSVLLAIYSKDSFLCQKEIRAVVSGEDGTILNVKNSMDTYLEGENVRIEVSFVGPADKSMVESAYIQLNIKSGGREIKSLRNGPLLLSTQPGLTEFRFSAPEELKEYDLEIVLGKGSDVFDSVVQSYRPMEPNLTITGDGRIISSNGQGCFDDGVCMENESKLGDCLDCQPMNKTAERQESEKYAFYKNISFALIGVIILLVLVIWWYKR